MTENGTGTPLAVQVSRDSNGPVLQVTGELDMSSTGTLVETGRQQLRGPAALLTVDLSGVGFCDSAGINGLVQLRKSCAEAGWQFRLVNLNSSLRRVICDLTGLGEFLNVQPSGTDAPPA
ncbi:MAG: STAS domain-containing protein [Micromonosporaceae bacterium]